MENVPFLWLFVSAACDILLEKSAPIQRGQ